MRALTTTFTYFTYLRRAGLITLHQYGMMPLQQNHSSVGRPSLDVGDPLVTSSTSMASAGTPSR